MIFCQKRRVITIDWQWMGGGCCATDVAYFIYTSVMLPEAATPRSAPPSPSKGAQKRKESLSNSSGSNSLTVPSTLSSNSANGNSLSSSASLERYPYYAPHEMELLKCYHAALMKRGVKDYPFEVFEQHYLMNVYALTYF
jgi:thiamine kinase-like enzyme